MSQNPTAMRYAAHNGTEDWRTEFGVEEFKRSPRTPDREIKSLLENSFEPRVHLKRSSKSIEIVFRFMLDTEPVPRRLRKRLARQGITLSNAFENVLYQKLDRETARSEMALPVSKTYSKAWEQYFSWAYKDHFHKRLNKWLEEIERTLKDRRPVSKGRKPRTQGEVESLQRRLEYLLPICEKIHSAAQNTSAHSRHQHRPKRTAFDRRHYHRLNDDYRLIHGLCRLFLEGSSISENVGAIRFRGFLLDMNQLFERFVTQAFRSCSESAEFSIVPQEESELSDSLSTQAVYIRPDVIVRRGERVVAVVDAKYKKITGPYKNHDLYQMVAYGTALACGSTYLYYPATESDFEGAIFLKNSSITIEIRCLDIENKHCVDLAEESANNLLRQHSLRHSSLVYSKP